MSKPLLDKLIQEIAMFDMDAACKLHQRKDKYNNNTGLQGVMVWEETIEQHEYWSDINKQLAARRENYHPHRDLMIEYANDRNIEIEYLKDDGIWNKCAGYPSFNIKDEYRKKPKVTKKVIEYRIYLDKKNKIHMIENKDTLPPHLKQWLSDWQKVEIEVKENDKGV